MRAPADKINLGSMTRSLGQRATSKFEKIPNSEWHVFMHLPLFSIILKHFYGNAILKVNLSTVEYSSQKTRSGNFHGPVQRKEEMSLCCSFATKNTSSWNRKSTTHTQLDLVLSWAAMRYLRAGNWMTYKWQGWFSQEMRCSKNSCLSSTGLCKPLRQQVISKSGPPLAEWQNPLAFCAVWNEAPGVFQMFRASLGGCMEKGFSWEGRLSQQNEDIFPKRNVFHRSAVKTDDGQKLKPSCCLTKFR